MIFGLVMASLISGISSICYDFWNSI